MGCRGADLEEGSWVCCSVLQCLAVCLGVLQSVCSVLQCVAVAAEVLIWKTVCGCVSVCCSVLLFVSVCCNVFVVCCSVLQLLQRC